jgi:hypothetical protein
VKTLVLASLLFALGCQSCAHTINPSPPPTDAGPSYEAACANLAAIGCPVGTAAPCATTLQQLVSDNVIAISVSCLTTAKDADAARACGGVTCR